MPSEQVVLAFDTSAAHCAAALLVGADIVESRSEAMGRGQAERLVPLLQELLVKHGFGWGDLTAIGVGTGPGNFTGIRISVATARGLGLALNRPAVGVTAFDAQAHGLPRPLLATVPAPRNRVYAQTMTGSGNGEPAICDDADLPDLPRAAPLTPDAMAEAIARIAASRAAGPVPRPAPVYLRPADATPPSDPAPVLLP